MSTNIPMVCGHCQRPCANGVLIGAWLYHEECTRGPGYQQPKYQPNAALTEYDVRRIVREELAEISKEKT